RSTRIACPGSVRWPLWKIRYVASGLHATDPPKLLARNVTGFALDGPPSTLATDTFVKALAPTVVNAMDFESGDQAKSRRSVIGGTSNTPVATSFSCFDTGSITRSSRESRSNAIHLPSGE